MLYYLPLLLVLTLCTSLPFAAEQHTPLTKGKEPTSIAWTAGWSHDDRFVAVGNDNGELAIYETAQWQKVKSWKYAATTISRVEWNPRHPVLAVASNSYKPTDSILMLFDMARQQPLKTLPGTVRGRGVSWSPDGESVAFVGKQGRISIFSRNGEHRKTLSFTNPRSLFDIDWHPTRNLFLAVEEDIYLIDMVQDRLIATYDDQSKSKGILCCQWHPAGTFFVTGDYGHENEGAEPSYLKYWHLDGTLIRRIKESSFEYRNLKWSRDGKYLVAATDVLLVLDKNGNLISKTKFDHNNLWGAEWNNKGDKIISSDQEGNIRITDIGGKVLKTFKL
jgi:WD40 repeat protein